MTQIMTPTTLHTAGLVVIQNRKILLAFSSNKKAFYLPGGKTAAGETAVEGLIREIKEELNLGICAEELSYLMHITAPAFGEQPGIVMEQDCYRYHLTTAVQPAAEIDAVRYFDYASYQKEENQAPGVLILFEQLRMAGLVD
jgi:ADP-ribose pyrophosphatase YjhB (NUDIX family)